MTPPVVDQETMGVFPAFIVAGAAGSVFLRLGGRRAEC